MMRYRIPTHLAVEPSLLRAELGPLPVDLTFRQATALALAAGFAYWLWQGSSLPTVGSFRGDPVGQVAPDAVARLALDGRRLTLLFEWDRGTEGAARLRRKLRHYVGWGASPAARRATALCITTTAVREALGHRLAAELTGAAGAPLPPLRTTTADRLVEAGALAPIWWALGQPGRRPLAP